MNDAAMARAHLGQAVERLRHAKGALEGGNYPYVVRQSQEAVELLLKAALRLVGVEPPKWHDVGPILRREAGKFPQ
jgi:HEPN domain-containing protein